MEVHKQDQDESEGSNSEQVDEQDQDESEVSNSEQMNKSTHLVQNIDSSDFEFIDTNLASKGESITIKDEEDSFHFENFPLFFDQLTEEQRVQKLHAIISEINQEGIYKGRFEEKFEIGKQLFDRYSFGFTNKQNDSNEVVSIFELTDKLTDNQHHNCSINWKYIKADFLRKLFPVVLYDSFFWFYNINFFVLKIKIIIFNVIYSITKKMR